MSDLRAPILQIENTRFRHTCGTREMCAYIAVEYVTCICVTYTFARGPQVRCASDEGNSQNFAPRFTGTPSVMSLYFFVIQFRLVGRLACE